MVVGRSPNRGDPARKALQTTGTTTRHRLKPAPPQGIAGDGNGRPHRLPRENALVKRGGTRGPETDVACHAQAQGRRDRAAKRDRGGFARHRAGRRGGGERRRAEALRVGRADRLPAGAHAGGAAGDGGAGEPGAPLLPRERHPRGAARLRHVAVGRCATARRRRASRHVEVQQGAGDRLRQPRRGGAAGRHQSRRDQCGEGQRSSTTRPIRRRRSPAPSAATWRRIPVACTA